MESLELFDLSIVRTVEVIASHRALGTSHVSSNDEMCAAVVLSDHHVLNSLPWTYTNAVYSA